MVPGNSLMSERIAFLSVINPFTAVPSAAASSTYIDLVSVIGSGTNTPKSQVFQRLYAVVQTGENATGTVTIGLYKASDTSGTGSTTVTAVLTYAATLGDNIVIPFDINPTLVDTSKPYISLNVSVDSGSCITSGFIIGTDGRYDPASSYNVAAVKTAITAL